ncbi:hypothetical protein WJX74_008086 [Apatococcus lobatus]|uniref:Uncharacterized protein n=1 Tax=Apatococcus lobatus TaxID=904363 RepID=A0AAW1RDD1_9CHLO
MAGVTTDQSQQDADALLDTQSSISKQLRKIFDHVKEGAHNAVAAATSLGGGRSPASNASTSSSPHRSRELLAEEDVEYVHAMVLQDDNADALGLQGGQPVPHHQHMVVSNGFVGSHEEYAMASSNPHAGKSWSLRKVKRSELRGGGDSPSGSSGHDRHRQSMDSRVQLFGSPSAECPSKRSSNDRSPSKRQKTPRSQAAANKPISQAAAGRAPSQAAAGLPAAASQAAPQAAAGMLHSVQPSQAYPQTAHARPLNNSRSSAASGRDGPSDTHSASANTPNGKSASPKQKKGIKKWLCACFGDAPTSAGQQSEIRASSQAQARHTPINLQPGQTITMQPGHHHLYLHDSVSVSFSDAAPHLGGGAVNDLRDCPQAGAQLHMEPADLQQGNAQALGLQQSGPSLVEPPRPVSSVTKPTASSSTGMQMGLRTTLPHVKTRMSTPVPNAPPTQHQRPALPEAWAAGSSPQPFVTQGNLQALDKLPETQQAVPGSLSMQYSADYHSVPEGIPQQPEQPMLGGIATSGHGSLGPAILKSQRDQILATSERDGPAWRTLQSLEDSLSGLLESHQSITTPSSGHLQGGNRVMSSMRTMSNLSGTISRGHVRTPTPESLLSTKDDVLDRDSKLLSADWTLDLFSSAPELGKEMQKPRPIFEFWAPPPRRPAANETTGGNVLFSDHRHEESFVPKAPQTPAPVGSSMQRVHHTHSMQPDYNMPFAFTAQRAQAPKAVGRLSQDAQAFNSVQAGSIDAGSEVAEMLGSGSSHGPRPTAMQGVGRELMATMPHERLVPYGQRQSPYSHALAMRNGRASAGKAGLPRLGRRLPKAAGSRLEVRKSYEPQTSKPSTTISSQGVDGSKLHTALEALLNRPGAEDSGRLGADAPGSSAHRSGSTGIGHSGMHARRKLIDSGTCEEVVSLLQQPGRRTSTGHNRSSREWSGPMSSRIEAREMRQEDMQALFRKQQILVEEAAQAAAEMEADQNASSEADELRAFQTRSARRQETTDSASMRSNVVLAPEAQVAASASSQLSSSARAASSPHWWAFPA